MSSDGWQKVGAIAFSSLIFMGLVGWMRVIQMQSVLAEPVHEVAPSQLTAQRMTQNSVDPKLVAANVRFGFKLFSETLKREGNKNVFVSPSSVAIALAMVYNGAAGETQQAMAKAMELQGISLSELNQANAELIKLLENPDPKVQLAIANSLWARQGIPFNPDFLQRNQQFYQAKVTELNFQDPKAVATINNWVSQNTRNKITEIVDRLNPDDVMMLINAIYFKGDWSKQFDPATTKQEPFFLGNGRQKSHPLMLQNGEYRYLENDQFQAVSLPYGNSQRMSMYVFLPKSSSTLSAFLQTLTADNWEQWMRQFRNREGSIKIPRFKLEYETELVPVLSDLGMKNAFTARANFAGLSSAPVQIDQVKHKTFVEVNEEGTKAAAVTAIGIRVTSIMPTERFDMVVNRPFFCAIRDNHTGTVLFMGAIAEPSL
ncbi:serpin family protein [Leptodesmis sp.]|uniref:serpin family protein n=1 Tax=Leptodesmis sp. TaxID=3100501 RepID=UPI0040534993